MEVFTDEHATGLAEKLQTFAQSLPEGERGLLAWMISAATEKGAEDDEVVPYCTAVELVQVGPDQGLLMGLLIPAVQKVRETANRSSQR